MSTKKIMVVSFIGLIISFNLRSESLADVYQLALKSDPTFLASKMEQLAVKEDVKQSLSQLLPRLDLNYNYSRSNSNYTDQSSIPNFNSETDSTFSGYGISLTQQIYSHANFTNLNIAKKRALQAALAYQTVKQELIIRVVEAYFAVLTANDNVVIADAQINSITQNLRTSESQLNKIRIKDYEDKEEFEYYKEEFKTQASEAKQTLDRSIADKILLEDELRQARESLTVITGRNQIQLRPLKIDVSLRNPIPNDIKPWIERSNLGNLKHKKALIDLSIAKKNVSLSKGQRYPTIDLSLNYGKSNDSSESTSGSNLPEISNSKFGDSSIGINFSLPIYAGGNFSSLVKQAKYRFKQASFNLDQVRREVHQQTRNAFYGVKASLGSAKALAKALQSAKESLQATEEGLKNGNRNLIDVFYQTEEFYTLQKEYAATRYQYFLNTLRLKQAVGNLSGNDVFELSRLFQ